MGAGTLLLTLLIPAAAYLVIKWIGGWSNDDNGGPHDTL